MAGNLDFQTTLSANTNTFISAFRDATNTIASLGNSADASAQNLEQMSQFGQQHIQSLNLSLAQARAELVHLSTTNATPTDITNAQNRIQLLQNAISQTTTVFDAYGAHAQSAMRDAANAAREAGAGLTPLQREVSTLVGGLDGVRASLDENGNSATHTRQQLEQMAESATTQLNQYKQQLDQARLEVNRLAATNASPADIEQARQRVRELETGVGQVETSLDGYRNAARIANDEAASGANRSASAFDQVNQGVNGIKSSLTALAGAIGLSLGVRELAESADSYTNLSARIQQATKEGGDFKGAMAGVHQVALMTNSSLDATANLFTRLNAVGKDMGMTQQQALDLTKTVTQAIQIGGGTAQQSEAAITQFIQAMQGGVLRGEEFNSMMENGYGVAEALAKGLGVTTGELRKMAENGELGAERVVKALQGQADQIQATYNQFPTTIGNALQRIATQWQIVIGEMDQASGASAVVANALLQIADNLGIIKAFLDDVGEGFVWIGDKLNTIDPQTINTLKSTISEAYDAVKSLVKNVGELGETIWSAFTTALDAVSPLFAALLSGKEEVSGLEVALNLLRMGFAVISDVTTGFNVGLKLLLSGIQFLSGGFYALTSQILGFLGFETLADQAQKASDRMFAQAEKNASNAVKIAQEHKWQVVETYNEIGKTQDQKNADQIANNQKTLDALKAQEEKHRVDYKAISDEKLSLEQALFEARKSGNDAAIQIAVDNLAKLDAKEKEYQAESKKINDDKIKAAQDLVNAQLMASDGTQKAADAATQQTLKTTLAAQGLKVEFDSAGKGIVAAMDAGTQSAIATGVAVQDAARKGATALGLDLDVALNRVSEKFTAGEKSVIDLSNGLEGMGLQGAQSSEVLYQAWQKWLDKAKSQAEIDAAKEKLIEFGKQGKLSASQVEMGMRYLDEVNGKLPQNISEVERAYKLLGLTSQAEASKMADSQIRAFNVLKESGTASVDQLKQALINMADKVYASGDAAKIAAYEAELGYRGLSSQVDQTGKTTVTSMNNLETSVRNVGNAFKGVQNSARSAGNTMREEAKSSTEAWNDAMESMKGTMHETPTGTRASMAYNSAAIKEKLIAQGYDEAKAEKLAKEIYESSKRGDGYKQVGNSWSFVNGGGGMSNVDYVNEQLDYLKQYASLSTKTPVTSTTSTSTPTTSTTATSKTVEYKFSSGGKTTSLYGSPNDGDAMEALLSEFEMIKKSS